MSRLELPVGLPKLSAMLPELSAREQKDIEEAQIRNSVNHHLVTTLFADWLTEDEDEHHASLAEVQQYIPKIVIDTAVAVLDIPREKLLERAKWLDKKSKKTNSLVNIYNEELKAAIGVSFTQEKSERYALAVVAGEMGSRIINNHAKSSNNQFIGKFEQIIQNVIVDLF